MMALFGNLSLLEIALIGALSVMIFGRNLPRTAAQLYTHFVRAKRALRAVWRESGLGEEFRQVHQEMERTANTLREQSPEALVREVAQDVEHQVREPLSQLEKEAQDPAQVEGQPQDSAFPRQHVPKRKTESEPTERPPWYPDKNDDPFDSTKPLGSTNEGGTIEEPEPDSKES